MVFKGVWGRVVWILAVIAAFSTYTVSDAQAARAHKAAAVHAATPASPDYQKDDPARLLGSSQESPLWTKEDIEAKCLARSPKVSNAFKDCVRRSERKIGHRMNIADIQEISEYKRQQKAKEMAKGADKQPKAGARKRKAASKTGGAKPSDSDDE